MRKQQRVHSYILLYQDRHAYGAPAIKQDDTCIPLPTGVASMLWHTDTDDSTPVSQQLPAWD